MLCACDYAGHTDSGVEQNFTVPPTSAGKEYVFIEYSWTHRPGTGPDGMEERLAAFEDWVMLPNPENDNIYNIKQYIAVPFSYDDCQDQLAERLRDDEFKNSGDCRDWQSTCYSINGNEINGTGYLSEYHVFHCVPYDFWSTLKPRADDKCYGPTGSDGWRDEETCSDYILNLDKDIYKAPSEFFEKIQKCPGYKKTSLFVCDSEIQTEPVPSIN